MKHIISSMYEEACEQTRFIKNFEVNFSKFCFIFCELRFFFKASIMATYFCSFINLAFLQMVKFKQFALLIDVYLYEKNINLEHNPNASYCDFYKFVKIENNFLLAEKLI